MQFLAAVTGIAILAFFILALLWFLVASRRRCFGLGRRCRRLLYSRMFNGTLCFFFSYLTLGLNHFLTGSLFSRSGGIDNRLLCQTCFLGLIGLFLTPRFLYAVFFIAARSLIRSQILTHGVGTFAAKFNIDLFTGTALTAGLFKLADRFAPQGNLFRLTSGAAVLAMAATQKGQQLQLVVITDGFIRVAFA